MPLNALTDGLRGLRESGAQVTSRAGDVLALGDERVRDDGCGFLFKTLPALHNGTERLASAEPSRCSRPLP
jgi:hypothetical protein